MIKLPEQSINYFYENCEEIFLTGELAEGKWNMQVADWICSYTGAPHALAVNSNGAGLFTILQLLKYYRSKKRIFLQSNTMYGVRSIAISSGLELCGYVNCSLNYLMPTLKNTTDFVNSLENPEECIFLVTHIGGWVNPDIERIANFCKEKGVVLIEDCAHSLGAMLDGKHSGLYGDAGVYSLYATKAIPVGEGGVIITKDKELHDLAKKFVMYDRFDQKMKIGINLRMPEINALLGFSVLQETENIIENKYKISKIYSNQCNNLSIEYINPTTKKHRANLYKFILLSRSADPVSQFSGISTRTSSVYDYCLESDPEEICKRHICLPVWYDLEESLVNKVLNELKKSN